MPAKLLYRDAQGRDGAVDLRAEAVYVGRAVECAVRTDDAMVSRRHSLISYIDGRYWIEDLGSSNGTHVNDVRVQRQALTHNDVVRCGSLWLRYIEEAPAAVIAPAPLAFPSPPLAAPPASIAASPGVGMPLVAPGGAGGPLAPSPFGPAPNMNMGLPPVSPGAARQMPAMPAMPAPFSPPPSAGAHGTPFAPTPFVPSVPTPMAAPHGVVGDLPMPNRTVSLKARPNEPIGKAQPQDFSEPTNAGHAQSDDVMLLQHELVSARQSIAELHAARDAAVAENRRLREDLGRRVQALSSELERLQGELSRLALELGARSSSA